MIAPVTPPDMEDIARKMLEVYVLKDEIMGYPVSKIPFPSQQDQALIESLRQEPIQAWDAIFQTELYVFSVYVHDILNQRNQRVGAVPDTFEEVLLPSLKQGYQMLIPELGEHVLASKIQSLKNEAQKFAETHYPQFLARRR